MEFITITKHGSFKFTNLENFIEAMERNGYPLKGWFRGGVHTRDELRNTPQFQNLIGPMWDGGKLRWESYEVYDVLSK